MAFTASSATLVKDKTRAFSRGSGVQQLLKAFWLHMASNKNNPDLQFVAIDGAVSSSDGGNSASQVICSGACTVYAIYLKKTGATATWFKATNHGSTATTDGTEDLSYKLTTASEEDFIVFPTGHALATGLTMTLNTTATGSTLSVLANRIDGFIIIGA